MGPKTGNAQAGAGTTGGGRLAEVSYVDADLKQNIAQGLNYGPFQDQVEKQIAATQAEIGSLPKEHQQLLESNNVTFAIEREANTSGRYNFLTKQISLDQDTLYGLAAKEADGARTLRHEVGHSLDAFYAIKNGGSPIVAGKPMSSADHLMSYSTAFQDAVARDILANRNNTFIAENKYYTAPNPTRTQQGDHLREMWAQTYSVASATKPGKYETTWAETFSETTAVLRSIVGIDL